MDARNTDLLELARLCRESHAVSAGIVGWLAAGLDDQGVADALEFAQELRRTWLPSDGHLALVEERYGPPAGMR